MIRLAIEFIATAAFFAAMLAGVIVAWAGFLAPPL